jgi:nucleoside-diphosphate-sugar epimerase
MRIFVTGATGVIGRPTVERLVAAGHEVTAVARSDEAAAVLTGLGASPVRVDLFDRPAVFDAVRGHEAVVNLATHIPVGRAAARREAWALNDRLRTEASAHLVDAAIAAGAAVFVQESVAFLYADAGAGLLDESAPLGESAVTPSVIAAEANADRFTAAAGRGIVLRFGGFHDHRSEHTRVMLRAARNGISLDIGRPDAYFPIIAVDDAADAVVAAVDAAPAGTYNVVDDEPMTHREQIRVWADVLGRKVRPLPAATARLVPMAAALATRSMRVSNRRFREATGWRPRHPSLRETLEAIVGADGGPPPRLSTTARVGLGLLLFTGISLGLWALLAPVAFFDDFPFGRGWVAADGPYNEHLVRDFGGLNLALAVFTWGALRSRRAAAAATAAVAWLAFALPHFAYHLHHLDLYDGMDVAGNVIGTAGLVAAAALVLVFPRTARRAPRTSVPVAASRPAPLTGPVGSGQSRASSAP